MFGLHLTPEQIEIRRTVREFVKRMAWLSALPPPMPTIPSRQQRRRLEVAPLRIPHEL
jgi:hypothetical protein